MKIASEPRSREAVDDVDNVDTMDGLASSQKLAASS